MDKKMKESIKEFMSLLDPKETIFVSLRHVKIHKEEKMGYLKRSFLEEYYSGPETGASVKKFLKALKDSKDETVEVVVDDYSPVNLVLTIKECINDIEISNTYTFERPVC